MFKKFRPDNIYSPDYISSSKKHIKTDKEKPIYEKSRVRRLTLFSIGKGNSLLSPSQIEKEVQKNYVDGRPNYVYEVLTKLVPESDEYPNVLLLRSDYFFDKDHNKKIHNIDNKEKLEKQIISRIFDSYALYLNWKDESELYYCELKTKSDKEKLIQVKSTKEDNNYITIAVNIDSPTLNDVAKIYYNKSEIPLVIKRQKGTINIYSVQRYSDISVKWYLDKIPKQCYLRNNAPSNSVNNNDISKISSSSIKNKEYGYVLNLRGLLLYLFLTKGRKNAYNEINQVIENLSKVDNYWNLENEFEPYSDEADDFSEHKVKERFPFLSYFNYFKVYLPPNYAASILIEIAIGLENELETMNIREIKYKVTDSFFNEIQDYFWESNGFSEPKITDRELIPDAIYDKLIEYQNEIRFYLSVMKEKELRNYLKRTEHYAEYNYINELRRKILNHLDKNNKSVIWIKDILYPTNSNSIPVGLTGTEISILQEICENSKTGYVTNKGFFLFKQTEIEKIKGKLKPKMTFDKAKEIIYKHGISNEDAIMDVLVLLGYKTIRDVDTKQKVIIKKT